MKKSPKELIFTVLSLAVIFGALAWRAEGLNPHRLPVAAGESYLRERVVRLYGVHGSCSGEQIHAPSGQNYILSAGHCHVLAIDNQIMIQTEDGKRLSRRVIEEDPKSDLLLLEGVPNLVGLELGNDTQAHQHVRTFTHGMGFDTYKTEGAVIMDKRIRVGLGPVKDISECEMPKMKAEDYVSIFGGPPSIDCILDVVETIVTAKIVPGSSGGMVVDDDNKLIGVCSASDQYSNFGFMVRTIDTAQFISNY